MSRLLRLLRPMTITESMLVSTNVPENDYPEWVSGTTYVQGARVIRLTKHMIYERLIAGAGTVPPEDDKTNWVEVGATNRWRCFDKSHSSASAQAGELTYTLAPGQIVNAVALLNIVGSSVRIQMVDPVDGVVYDKTTSLQRPPSASNWYAYFFDPISFRTQLVSPRLPSYRNAQFIITVTAAIGNASCGVILLGKMIDIGLGVLLGARLSIDDFSTKERTTFGDFAIVERGWSRRAHYDMWVKREDVDRLQELLAAERASPGLWIGSERYESSWIYGLYRTTETTLSFPERSRLSVEIEGFLQ